MFNKLTAKSIKFISLENYRVYGTSQWHQILIHITAQCLNYIHICYICLNIVALTITTPLEGQQFNITEGSNGSITCTATGYPVPTVVWQNSDGSSLSNNRLVSGSPVNISSTGVGNVTSVSVELMVIGAMRADTGIYRCSANNSISNTTRNISITVQCKLQLVCVCVCVKKSIKLSKFLL